MSPSLSYTIFPFLLFCLILSFPAKTTSSDPLTEITAAIPNATWHNFGRLIDAGKGSNFTGLSELKKYFQRFGYLNPNTLAGAAANFTDIFDENLENAIRSYQENLGLVVSGKLDSSTVTQIMSPRCGVSDSHPAGKLHVTKRYAFFYGRPRWSNNSPITLTYAFSPKNMIDYIDISEIRDVFQRSFSRWSSVIPVNFTEAKSGKYSDADIKIGFYSGDHGDGEAFDGVLGVLAHAFSPENGRFHLDAAETWAIDLKKVKSREAVDLESVVTHEIGHILGMAHTSVKEAIMYPSLSPRTKKVDLKMDDVEGIQALYGPNPDFKYSSLLESDSFSSWAVGLERRLSLWVSWSVMVVSVLCLCL